MSNCKCEHWQICPVCKPEMHTKDGRLIEVTREMICAAHGVTLERGDVVLSASLLERIYRAMRSKEPKNEPWSFANGGYVLVKDEPVAWMSWRDDGGFGFWETKAPRLSTTLPSALDCRFLCR